MYLTFLELQEWGEITILDLWECVRMEKQRLCIEDYHPDPDVDLKRMRRNISVYKSWDYIRLIKERTGPSFVRLRKTKKVKRKMGRLYEEFSYLYP
jgi:hypothetical protein